MFDRQHIYGLDIETDNSAGHGLNPRLSAVTQIALVTGEHEYVFDGDERSIITDFSRTLETLEAGLVVDWNGSFFDHPFIIDRAKALNEPIDVAVQEQPLLRPKYGFLPGYTSAVNARWRAHAGQRHSHLDIAPAYRQFAESHGESEAGRPVVPWSLKPVMRALGLEPVELDRTRLQDYTPEEVNEYVLSDARGARGLALRRLGVS